MGFEIRRRHAVLGIAIFTIFFWYIIFSGVSSYIENRRYYNNNELHKYAQ